jgi:lipopolysaccharide export system protein LptA
VSWRRNARIAAGLTGLGVAAALFFMRRDRPPVAPPPQIVGDPASKMESQHGKLILLSPKDGRQTGTITFERIRTYDDGRQRLEQATLKMDNEDPFELSADAIDTKGAADRGNLPPEIDASGNVRFKKPSGLQVETSTAKYKDKGSVVEMPESVTFRRDRMTGTGTGAIYRRDAKTLEILANAHVSVVADAEGKGALEASAGTMVLNQADHALHLDRSASIYLEERTLEATRINLQLTDDESAIKQLRMLGAAKVTPKPNAKNAGPAMNGDAIDLALRPDGRTVHRATLMTGASVVLGTEGLRAPWIDLDLAPDGSTVTRLDARDGVHVDVAAAEEAGARTIDARTLKSTGNEKVGLTSARFEGDVRFGEAATAPGGAPIKSTSRVLVLTLAGGLGAIESAEFLGEVSFTDGVVSAGAERAIYDAKKDRLELRPGGKPTPRPTVQDARVNLSADTVDLNTQTHAVHAKGAAETELLPEKSPKPGGEGALFDRSKPIRGSGPEVDYSSTTGRATYKAGGTVRARVWQDANDVTADEITLDDATQNLSARRRVQTVLEMTPLNATDSAKPELYRIKSEEADFDQTARRATFKGKPVELSSADRTTDGHSLEIRLAPKTRAVEGFTFVGDVLSRLPEGREALSDRLVHDATKETYTLIGEGGKLALLKTPSGDKTGECGIMRGLTIHIDQRTKEVRSDGEGSNSPTVKVPCDTALRSIRR